mmetsp:Transcript_40390/g.102218  ORF Transcript_40390/g.102218 Transcript_40390/m.102218 type:complete len:208 (-) Transcript_40390:625-1248(-)
MPRTGLIGATHPGTYVGRAPYLSTLATQPQLHPSHRPTNLARLPSCVAKATPRVLRPCSAPRAGYLRASVIPRAVDGGDGRVGGKLPAGVRLRPGREPDLGLIAGAVFSEKMNPLGLRVERFVVAEEAATGELVGFGQLKEWPCLADKPDLRGQLVRSAGLVPNWEVRSVGQSPPDAPPQHVTACLLGCCRRTRTIHSAGNRSPSNV